MAPCQRLPRHPLHDSPPPRHPPRVGRHSGCAGSEHGIKSGRKLHSGTGHIAVPATSSTADILDARCVIRHVFLTMNPRAQHLAPRVSLGLLGVCGLKHGDTRGYNLDFGAPAQSDKISHIDMGDDRIDPLISHIISLISHIDLQDDHIDMLDNHIDIPYPKSI